jgi:hypothetical protein
MLYKEKSCIPKKYRWNNCIKFITENPDLTLDEVCAVYPDRKRVRMNEVYLRVHREMSVYARIKDIQRLHRLAIAPVKRRLIKSCRQPDATYASDAASIR